MCVARRHREEVLLWWLCLRYVHMSKLAKLYNTQYSLCYTAFPEECSDKPPLHVSTPPHCCFPPNLLTVKTRAAVGRRLPFCEACQGRWGAWSVQSEVLREARCCEHEGADTSVDVLILETPVIFTGHAIMLPAYTWFWKSLVIMDRR